MATMNNAQPNAAVASKPPAPMRAAGPDPIWQGNNPDLYANVKKALTALPQYFKSTTVVNGTSATDVFGFNTVLGSAIEIAVVETLNGLRSVWDPQNKYPTYSFQRFSQSFPDVRLMDSNSASATPILMGIEVKGWFVLSKEAEPSFRYVITPAACNLHDLILIVPWKFDNVISGTPVLLPVFIEQARYAAEARNFYWTWDRGNAAGRPDDLVDISAHTMPYPLKTANCSDRPVKDGGGNFGRVARTKLMADFVNQTLQADASGIPVKHWISFLKVFTDGSTSEDQSIEMAKLAKKAAKSFGLTNENMQAAIPYLKALLDAANTDT
jgi:hypothetical protein